MHHIGEERRVSVTPILALAVPILLLNACAEETATARWTGTVRDSAGITIVENTSDPLWQTGEEWTVVEELRIGTLEGEPEYQFGALTPGFPAVAVDTEGNLHVLDPQAQEVRVFDPQGVFLRRIGGPGSGPGEFGLGTAGVFLNDTGTIYIPDMTTFRVSTFDASGEYLSSYRMSPAEGIPLRWETMSDGRLAAQLRYITIPGTETPDVDFDPVVAFEADGTRTDTILRLPKGESFSTSAEGLPQFRLFEPEPIWELSPSGLAIVATNDQYRLEVLSAEGTVLRVIVMPTERVEVTEGARQAILKLMEDAMMAQGNAPPALIQQILAQTEFAPFYPAFTTFFAGPAESVWVQKVQTAEDLSEEEAESFDPQNLGSPDWDVFDSEGRFLGIVTLPRRFTPVVSRGDQLFGWLTDDLDVPYIVRLRVDRPMAD